jgi:hypothetical protein
MLTNEIEPAIPCEHFCSLSLQIGQVQLLISQADGPMLIIFSLISIQNALLYSIYPLKLSVHFQTMGHNNKFKKRLRIQKMVFIDNFLRKS